MVYQSSWPPGPILQSLELRSRVGVAWSQGLNSLLSLSTIQLLAGVLAGVLERLPLFTRRLSTTRGTIHAMEERLMLHHTSVATSKLRGEIETERVIVSFVHHLPACVLRIQSQVANQCCL